MRPRMIGAAFVYLLSACAETGHSPEAKLKQDSDFSTPHYSITAPMAVPSSMASSMAPALASPALYAAEANTEDYTKYEPNAWLKVAADNLSTFAVDVDTASYTISRRKLNEGTLPPASAIRVEEFVNYFSYDYQAPTKGAFAVHMEAAPSPFTTGRVLLKVGLQGKKIEEGERLPAHLTFLVDTSGSMHSDDKLGLVKRSLKMMVERLQPGDTVAITTYAGDTRVVLAPTSIDNKSTILAAIDDLTSGGGTAMADGLSLAYEQAMKGFKSKSINRVILLSDGDANLGPSTHEEMFQIISGYVSEGITLTTVGVGGGNYNDTTMEQLANKGNGNYVYLDGAEAAKRFFVEQLGSTLQVIAKDVKIQVEFSKDAVVRYRLIGYENRAVADQDFRNDKVDAGEIGAGHSVTALYELELSDKQEASFEGSGTVLTDEESGSARTPPDTSSGSDQLVSGYGEQNAASSGVSPDSDARLSKLPRYPLATVRVRAKQPDGTTAEEQASSFTKKEIKKSFTDSSQDFQFATAVVGFAEKLRQNPDALDWKLSEIKKLAKSNSKGKEERVEFVQLIEQAEQLGLNTSKIALP